MTDVVEVPVLPEPAAAEIKTEPETVSEEVKDLVPELYDQHGGDPRLLDISFCVLLSRVSSAFLSDPFETFTESIKSMLSEELKLDPATLKQIVRIPKLEQDAPDQSNALRVLLCFTEKTHKHRMMGRKKDIEISGMKVESLDELPAELLEISDEDARALADLEMADEVGEDEVAEEVEEDEHEEIGAECDEEANGQEASAEGDKKEEEDGQQKKETEEDKKTEKKPEPPKKKVYEDEDVKAPFEVNWEGAPEFQWRLCDGPRDEKKLVIENLLWADLNNVFIYRTIQKATSCDLNFPMRYSNEGSKAAHGKMSLYFPGFVAIMDEALKHLIYFRSSDGRRIKVFLPQTVGSLKRKEDFEGKLGRLIKPTPRMMELIIKPLPENYTPTLDEACTWFPLQAVIECNVADDEMGKPCAIVKFETAEEAVAAHAGKPFVNIVQKVTKKDAEGNEKEETVTTNCNVFMRGVEAHFGSLITYYDQKKKSQEQQRANAKNRKSGGPQPVKRPAGSTIRGPAQKRRAPSPAKPRGASGKDVTPRGGGRGGMNRITGRGGQTAAPRRSSPPRSSTRGGRTNVVGGMSRSAPRPSYRNDSFSNQQRAPMRADAFSGYSSYAQFDNRYNDRPQVDPFGRPMYGNSSAFGSSFHRDDAAARGYANFQDRRRY